ncbi:MAG: mannose-6-phosphate isomerase [Nanoarchaeota archaeon]|nr:mannose-6-phosphate isomerase [Nanoarchaeota archaeon]|tara:strand:+ start:726 stop:1067 length:342 start_codon:yes stop_codon:yes gene_type:complete
MKRHKFKSPWGINDRFTLNEKSTVKILTIKPRQAPSIQYHHKRAEFWRILEGRCKVTLGKKTIRAKPGDEFYIPKKKIHSIEAYSKQVKILEISLGTFDEKDIVRLKDKYGRV